MKARIVPKDAARAAGDNDDAAKLLYHPCRTGVFAPVGWRSSDTGRSVLPPAAALQLEWVHGYAGVSNLGNNLWCASSGEAVYYTAAVGVVFDAAAHSQRFFLGHDDDISCLTIDGSRTHAASGQVGAQPLVLVWAVSSLEQLARLRHGRVLGVTAVGFSADGELLASVGRDDLNTVHVWDWRHERLLSTVEGQKAVPPAVWGVQWAPAGGAVASEQQLQVAGDGGASPACLVSYGAKHIKLWGSKDGRGKTASWSMKVLRFGESGAADVLGVAVLPSGVLVSGAPDGKLLVWRGGEVVARLRAHGHECRVVTLARGGRQLLSGGGDGRVLVWGVAALEGVGQPAAEAVAETDRKLAALRLRLAELDGRAHKAERAQVSMEVYALEKGRHGGSLELEPERVLAVGGGGRAAAVRGLDGEASGGGVLVGTSGCDVVRVSGEGVVAMVVDGHTADLHGVARSPVDGRLFATACDSAKVKVWDAQARCALLELRVGGAARAVCFSRDGAWLAVGLLDGSVEVLALPQVFEAAAGGGGSKLETRLHDSRRAVSALAWSPDGATLAVGNVEGSIDLYDVARWTRLARCRGHSTKVTQLDWSRDAALLQSNCNAYEILYWEGRSGRQVRSPQREYTQWDGWSCTLGWPVMGIWQEGFDPSDVNAAHASDDGSLVVVSDDRGGVCLFRFPCVAPRAACSRAAGHASHVSSVRWLLGSERCVSVGGHDRAVMQWRLVERPEPRASPPAQPSHSPAPTGLLAPRRDLPAALVRAVQQQQLVPASKLAQQRTAFAAAVLACTPRYDAPRYVAKLMRALGKEQPDSGHQPAWQQLQRAWGHFELPLSDEEAHLLSGGLGSGVDIKVDHEAWARSLFASNHRALGHTCVRGPRSGLLAPGADAAKLLYHPCRTGVFAPVGWRSSDTGRSVLPPAAALQLEWVHGYAGVSNLGNNLWCASSGEAVYYTAAVGVVFDAAAHSQRFFLGHDDDISCLTIDGSRTHAASGQVGAQPLVLVWAVSSLEQLARLRHGRVLGVTAVGFSADGELLASVGRDDLNTVHVWDWRHERLLSTVEGQKAVPPAVWGVQWAPAGGAVASEQQLQVAGDGGASPACLVSYGAKHIKLWGSKDGRGKTASWSMKVLRFGESGAADVLGVAVLPSGVLVSGAPDGKLLVWRGGEVVARLRAHGHECRVVTLARGGRQLLSGGGDGRVLVWGVAALEGVGQPAAEAVAETDRKLAALRLRLAELDGRAHKAERAQVSMEVYALEKGRHGGSLELEPERVLAVGGGGRAAAVRGLDGEASGGGVLVGTSGCDVVRVSGEGVVAMVVDGHTADLHGVARSPVDGRLFATACDSAKVKVWDAQARCALLELRVGGAARAVCFSRDGAWLAVGLLDGSVEVLALPQVFEAAAGGGGSKLETRLHDSRRAVSALAWSPDGATLAVGNVEGSIDLYDVARWTRLARCRGHSTKVTQLDWSRDAALLQSNCNAYEILYWEGRSGRQVRSPQREYTQWDGWSCTLGWPVMGIWQEGFDPSDVNAAHASDDGSLVVVSDDRGGVCLFRFPCVAPRAACSRAAGHASHVSSVRWLLGSERCVSVGGHDRAVMQWRLVERPEPRASPPAQPSHSPAPTGLLAPRRDLPATATTMPRSIT